MGSLSFLPVNTNQTNMKKLSLFLLLFLSLVSCNEVYEDFHESADFMLHSRECKYMWAFNVSKTEKPYYGITTIENEYIGSKQSVSVQNYTLEFTTCNVDMDVVNYGDSLNYKKTYDSGDEEILFRIPVYYPKSVIRNFALHNVQISIRSL